MALTTVQDYIAAASEKAGQNERSLLCVKDSASNDALILEANKTTGRIPVDVVEGSQSVVDFDRYDIATSGNITDAAYTEITASLSASALRLQIFNSAGTLYLATGAAASETDLLIIPPGGGLFIIDDVTSGDRVSLKSVSGTLSSGEIIINYFG